MRHIYAKVETNFFNDARFRSLRDGEKLAYLACWLLAVETSNEVLPPVACTSTYLGHRAGVHPNSVRSMIEKALTFTRPLLERQPDGGLRVCGVTKLHPTLFIKHRDREEKRREENTREEIVAVGEELEDSNQTPPPEQIPNLPELAQKATKLPWQQLIPWFGRNMHRWPEIKDPDAFASKVLVRCIDELGFRWDELEERLRDSSEYLKAHTKKYKSARGFYWNQIDLYKRRVPPDPKPKRQTDAGDVAWPAGAVRLQSGVFYDSQGKAIETVQKGNGEDHLISHLAKKFSQF